MSWRDAAVFDAEQLPMALESNEEDVLCEFYELFLVQIEELVNVFGSPGIATQADSVRLLAHKLKSSSLSVGAMRLGEQLAELEARCFLASSSEIELLVAGVVATAGQTDLALRTRLRNPSH
jgi:HPt (histidine-containing phosphotransfer) domain-containing protein